VWGESKSYTENTMATIQTQVESYRTRLAAELAELNARVLELHRMRPQLERSTYLTRAHDIAEDRSVLVACVMDCQHSERLSRRSVICL